ncbi:MAG TPA: alpha/beta fold hydrolase [Gemmatimonadota bacterium]
MTDWLLRAALAAAAAWVGAGALVAWRLNRFPARHRIPPPVTPESLGVPATTVRFAARDGHPLEAWFVPARSPRGAIVVALHGYRGSRADVLEIGAALWRAGFGVLAPDFRGRGGSGRTAVTLGAHEVHDLAGTLAWLRENAPGSPVGLLGYSMGAAVALMEGGRHPEVRAIASDCGYVSQAALLEHRLRGRFGPAGTLALPAAAVVHRLLWRRPAFDRVEPIRHAAEWRGRGLLFIGAGCDVTVDPEDALRLFDAAPRPKMLWLERGAEHCSVRHGDPDRYERIAVQFFRRYLEVEPAGEPEAA